MAITASPSGRSDHTMTRAALLSVLMALTTAITPDRPEVDAGAREKRSDDVRMSFLQALVLQQASVIQTLRAELRAHGDRVNTVETSLHALQDTLARDVQTLNDRIAVTSRVVAFSARISAKVDTGPQEGVPLGHHQTVVFDEAETNVGNAYNPNNGIFTAPVTGVYAFFLNLMTPNHNHGDLTLAITKNGTMLDVVYGEGKTDQNDQGSSLVTTHLVTGDQVWVRENWGNAVRGDWWTIFTGFLLQTD